MVEETKLQFFHTALSPPSMVVASTLGYFDFDYIDTQVNLLKGEHKRPAFLAINPDGAVPAIREGQFCLNEGIAIWRYTLC